VSFPALIDLSGVSSEQLSVWTGITASIHESHVYVNVIY